MESSPKKLALIALAISMISVIGSASHQQKRQESSYPGSAPVRGSDPAFTTQSEPVSIIDFSGKDISQMNDLASERVVSERKSDLLITRSEDS